MKLRLSNCITAITAFAALAIPIGFAAQHDQNSSRTTPRYSLTILSTLGGCCGIGHGINQAGNVAGASVPSNNAELHAAIWRRSMISDLGTLGGPNSNTAEEQVINDRDIVAAFSDTSSLDPNGEDFCFFGTNLICLPFVWSKGVRTPLPTLGGTNASANGLNNRGEVVGISETPSADACSPDFLQVEAALWRDGHVSELPPLPGDSDGEAIAVNDDGDVIGLTGCATGTIHAIVWRYGAPTDLGNLGGEQFNIPGGINNRGQITGESDLAGETTHHAFFWDRGVMTDLGTLPGYAASVGNGINNREQVVGFGDNGVLQVAVLWEGGVATDLNTLIAPNSGWFLSEALSINERGEITGYAFSNSTGFVQTFILTPCDSRPAAKGCGSGGEDENAVVNSGEARKNMQHAMIHRMLPRASILRWYAQHRTPTI